MQFYDTQSVVLPIYGKHGVPIGQTVKQQRRFGLRLLGCRQDGDQRQLCADIELQQQTTFNRGRLTLLKKIPTICSQFQNHIGAL